MTGILEELKWGNPSETEEVLLYKGLEARRRGLCLTYPDCSFLVETGTIRCCYCGCPPANHQSGKNTVFKFRNII